VGSAFFEAQAARAENTNMIAKMIPEIFLITDILLLKLGDMAKKLHNCE
jgi:hypothetical protein